MIRALICLLSLAAAAIAAADTAERLRDLQREIGASERRIDATQAARRDLGLELANTEKALAKLQRESKELRRQIAHTERQLQELQTRRDQLAKTRHRQLQHLADDVAIAYRLGGGEPVKVLLNLEDPLAAQRMLRYYGYLTQARATQLQSYRRTDAELGALAAEVDAEQARLRGHQTALAKAGEQHRAALATRRELLAALDARLSDEQLRVQKLRTEARDLQSLLDKLARDDPTPAPTTGPFAGQAGRLPWPVAGQLLHRYGESRAGSLRWSGWLIAAGEGDPVRAVHAGTVVFADYLRGHGQLIIVDHGGGYLTLYAHNQTLLKTAGSRINGGEILARAGSSGGLNRNALYFEIRKGSKTLDPGRWLHKKS